MMYTHQCFVRFDDLDSYGHVNNVTVAEYLREARLAFVTDVLGEERFVVARQVINYRVQVPWRTEPLAVDLTVSGVGRASFAVAYEIHDHESVFVTAETVLVAVDGEPGSPRPLRQTERQALSTYAKETS